MHNRLQRLKKAFLYLAVTTSILQTYAPVVRAVEEGSVWSPQTNGITSPYTEKMNGSEFFKNECVTPEASASGPETPLTFPKGLDDKKMADIINEFIDKNKGPNGSILEGVGEKAVASAKKANVNPFLVIAQSRIESQTGSKGLGSASFNVDNANNSFGRSATESQPHVSGAKLWYKWSSGEASVDSEAPENKGSDSGDQYSYIRTVYSQELDAGDWKAYFQKYAPSSDGNSEYHRTDGSKPFAQQWTEEMMTAAGGSSGGGGGGSSSSGSDGGLASDTPEPGFASTPGTNGHKRILVHTTEGDSAEQAIQALKAHDTSYHTIIEKDGKERRLLSDDAIAHGATDSNNASLHVALVGVAGDGSHFDPDSPQLKTLEKRLAKWAKQYDIPLEKISGPGVLNSGDGKGVAGHGDVAKASPASYASSPRSDPGEKFPWDEVLKRAKGESGSSANSSNDQCCAESDTNTTSLGLTGGDNAEKVFNYLTSKGMDAKIAAGFVGNFMQESGPNLDPTADNGSHKGIAQWDYGNRYGLLEKLKGDKANTIEAQAWYVGCELGLEDGDGCGNYKDAYSYIQQANSPEDAATRVDEKYEISGRSALENRQNNAKEIFGKFGDGAASGTSSPTANSAKCKDQEPTNGDFVYYSQNDPQWQVDGLDIAAAGCGPTSIAMILATMKNDKTITPVVVAKYLQEKGSWGGGGLQFSAFPQVAEKWGVKVTEIGTDYDKAKEALKAKKYLILSGDGGFPPPFCTCGGGHLVAARGVTDDGKITVANPSPNLKAPDGTKEASNFSTPIPGLKNMWVFE